MSNNLPIHHNAREVFESMNWGLFESFCEMLDSIPTKAVLRAVEAERKMVEDDLENKRTECDQYVVSVLGFCNFLTLAVCGVYASMAALPVEHRVYYGKIVQRLVDAGELPSRTAEHFNRIASGFNSSPTDTLQELTTGDEGFVNN